MANELKRLREALADFDARAQRALLASDVTPVMVKQTRDKLVQQIATMERGASPS